MTTFQILNIRNVKIIFIFQCATQSVRLIQAYAMPGGVQGFRNQKFGYDKK